MTYIAFFTRISTGTNKEYKTKKNRLLKAGYRITRDYETATHFNNSFGEVVLYKDFNKEVTAIGRT